MSTITTVYNSIEDSCCAKVIQAIDAINSNANNIRPTGTLAALQSPQNKGTFSLVLDPNKARPTSGSFRSVYTKDIKPVCDQDTTADSACAEPSFSADDPTDNYVFSQHYIDLSIKREITLDLDDFKSFCLSPTQYIADRLLAFRSGVLSEINSKLTDRVIGYVGKYYSQLGGGSNSITAPKAVSFLSANSLGGFAFDPTGYAKIKDEYAKLGYAYDSPIIVGGSHLATLQTNSAFMGGTNLNGVNSTGVPNLFVDYGVDVAFADGYNWLATWKPGALQVANVNEISDDMIRISVPNQRERMRVSSPFGDGLEWDYYWDVDSTGCQYKLKFQAWFDAILPVPPDTCAPKPVLFFNVDCAGNDCPENGYPSGVGGIA